MVANIKFFFTFLIIVLFSSHALSEGGADIKRKYELVAKSADAGDTGAMLDAFVIFYSSYPLLENKINIAVKYLSNSALQGNVTAQYYMGYLQLNGDVFEENLDKAIIWLKRAESNGHVVSKTKLGLAYLQKYHNDQTKKEYLELAQSWFKDAALAGDVAGMRQYGLGILAHHQDNFEVAEKWLTKAAKKQDSKAMVYLGQYNELKYTEYGKVKDKEKAVYWFKEAAKLGNKKAVKWVTENSNNK